MAERFSPERPADLQRSRPLRHRQSSPCIAAVGRGDAGQHFRRGYRQKGAHAQELVSDRGDGRQALDFVGIASLVVDAMRVFTAGRPTRIQRDEHDASFVQHVPWTVKEPVAFIEAEITNPSLNDRLPVITRLHRCFLICRTPDIDYGGNQLKKLGSA